jgi:hypothetical protein
LANNEDWPSLALDWRCATRIHSVQHLPGKQRVHGEIEGSNGNLASKPVPASTHPTARYVSPAMAVVG